MLKNKKIIVVMPAYNAEKTLQKTYAEIPHNIVDDIAIQINCCLNLNLIGLGDL